jgi:hypothetical protein
MPKRRSDRHNPQNQQFRRDSTQTSDLSEHMASRDEEDASLRDFFARRLTLSAPVL